MISKNQLIANKKKFLQTKKNKRVVPILNCNISELQDLDIMANNEDMKDIVFNSLLNGVIDAVEKNKNDIDLIKIKNSNSFINLKRSNWVTGLSNAIQFFSDKQQFEEASECQKLIELINGKES